MKITFNVLVSLTILTLMFLFFIIIGTSLNHVVTAAPHPLQLPTGEIVVVDAQGNQEGSAIVPDGTGGYIISWVDERGTNKDIYAQRINKKGNPEWTEDGIIVSNASGDQSSVSIVSDGAGGAIISWIDERGADKDIYAQRINKRGRTLWTNNGIVVSNATGNQLYNQMIADEAGGAIISWVDERGVARDIYAQRINNKGISLWTTNGVVVCDASKDQDFQMMTGDGYGGTFLVWGDDRSDAGIGVYDIYAQYLNSSGESQWTQNGVLVCDAYQSKMNPRITQDGSGGVIIVWDDMRNYLVTSTDIYAQRLDSTGQEQWASNGIVVVNTTNMEYAPWIISDNSGGAFLMWHTGWSGSMDLYAQRINGSGVVQWDEGGVVICNETNDQMFPQMVTNGTGGFISVWYDLRNDSGSRDNGDVYTQTVSGDGIVQGSVNGDPVVNTLDNQVPGYIVSNGSGGVVVTWTDDRAGNNDIYAKEVPAD